jgi:hypothetical protein
MLGCGAAENRMITQARPSRMRYRPRDDGTRVDSGDSQAPVLL